VNLFCYFFAKLCFIIAENSLLFRSLIVSSIFSIIPVSAATFDVTRGDWGDDSTVNSFAWAIRQANNTPGADVIRLFSDVNVDLATPLELVTGILTELTDTAGLKIEANNHSLVGNPFFLTANGHIVDKNFPRPYLANGGDSLQVSTSSFARIADNVANVRIDTLVVDGLNAFLNVGQGSVAAIAYSTIKHLVGFGYGSPARYHHRCEFSRQFNSSHDA